MTRTNISSQIDNKYINTNQSKNNTSNTDDNYSCITPQKYHSGQASSKTTHLTPLNATLYLTSVNLHTTTKLPLTGKKYLCFMINKKKSQTANFVK